MATVIVTMRIMPEHAGIDFTMLKQKATDIINSSGARVEGIEEEPVAFGLKALKLHYAVDENQGDTEQLEKKLSEVEGIQSVSVVSVGRAIG